MKKALPYLLLVVLAIALLLLKRCGNAGGKDNLDSVDRNKVFDRRTAFLEYTDHAKCRMDCERVSHEQVSYVLAHGAINNSRTEPSARPCPIYTLEALTPDSLHLRVVFAQCDKKTKVVTCIKIDSAFNCRCAGVGTKYEH